MFSATRDYSDIAIGVIVTVIVVATFIAIGRTRTPIEPAELMVEPVVSEPSDSHDTLITARVIKPTEERPSKVIATVYECFANGQRILSDRPCASDAATREVLEPNRMAAQDTSRLYEPIPGSAPRRASSVPNGRASEHPANAQLCASIERQIKLIDERMRQKYTKQQGENFRERLRDLRENRWEANCRWLSKD